MTTHTAESGMIGRARRLAAATPPNRNRYADFLRAASILLVVIGHWLVAAPFVVEGELEAGHMLARSPWTQWLTWVFQVMPVFFAVGGYSNTVSWSSARQKSVPYGLWLMARLRRLAIPAGALVAVWGVGGVLLHLFGVDPDLVTLGSQASLVPVWFLAVYIGIIALGPVMVGAWRRYGWGSFGGLIAAAVAVDLVVVTAPLAGWLNFLFVWSAIHQLGVAWAEGRLDQVTARIVAAAAAVAAIALVTVGPYPIAMVGVPGAEASNNTPPTVALAAFGTMQVAGLLAVQVAGRRALQRASLWTGTVLINGMIMSIYLWHLTAMVLVIGGSLLLGGVGLHIEPATTLWWLTRPVWIAVLGIATLPFIAIFVGVEQVRALPDDARPNPLVAVGAAVALTAGLGVLASSGIQGGMAGINPVAVGLPLAGAMAAALAGRRSGR